MFSNGPTAKHQLWTPPALRVPVLVITVLMCWALIAILQYLLIRSQRDSGIMFAPKINDLPLRKTFFYQHFPTIVSVVFSIYWAWIDLETKRMEPYYQLSKKNGALGKDSLLLHYPFDFLPLVPLKACKDRHWPVFCASFAVLLVTWGLVPTQAGIFSVQTITRTTNATFSVSTSNMPVAEQASRLSFRYAQSTYGIVTLNETLPPFMARNYTLAPFKITNDSSQTAQGYGNWTAETTMYFLELYCENVSHQASSSNASPIYLSSNGCNFTAGLTGNLTVGEGSDDGQALAIRQYTGQYIGYWNPQGFADYSLDKSCPKTANQTFFAAFSKSKNKEEDTPQDVAAIYCTPFYYQQSVSATVDILNQRPLNIRSVGEKHRLAMDIFNITIFEELLNTRSLGSGVRGDILPATSMPRYLESLANLNVSLTGGTGSINQAPVGLALGVGNRPLEEYLDWKVLSKSYADAYRLIFARAMVDVLGNDFRSSKAAIGKRQIRTEAVVLQPLFTYIVEGLLGIVSLATLALLCLSLSQKRNLHTDPNTIASVMAITADNQPLLSGFAELDCCTVDEMQSMVGNKRYKLVNYGHKTGIVEVGLTTKTLSKNQSSTPFELRRKTPTAIAKPVRPVEFSLWVAFPLVNLFIVLAVALGVIYMKARVNGLPLPSSNKIVQNLLENYIPTAIATMIEPVWVLLNRLLCMLQPLEELRHCNAKAKESINLNYSSLPPQLVIFKAIKSSHFILAAVCGMALLSNLLAVAFAGLFNQAMIDMRRPTKLYSPYDLKFAAIDGTIGPVDGQDFGSRNFSGAYQGGDGEDQFLVAESNYTRGTPLPAWTDDTMFYLPLFAEGGRNSISNVNTSHYEALTPAFGAELDCTELTLGGANFEAALKVEYSGSTPSNRAFINITIPKDSGDVHCSSPSFSVGSGPIDCVNSPASLEFTTKLNPRVNATREETEACMRPIILGWVRHPQGSCPFGKEVQLTKENSLFIQCQPRWVVGTAKIRVDGSGRLQHRARDKVFRKSKSDDDSEMQQLFSNDAVNLMGQSSRYLIKLNQPAWHGDSFTSDFINYFIKCASNSSRLIDPIQHVPTFNDVLGPLNKAYAGLFAIWLSTNKEKLLVHRETEHIGSIEAWRIEPETRLFLSTPMFVISEVILCTYAMVAIMVYMRRPGQYLARLPTSVASSIALFAASSAVQDMRDTSHLNKKGRARHLEDLDSRYGYGSFVGGDGRLHIGIEKTPFVTLRSTTTWLEKRVPLFRKASAGR
ncbi:uncharacterized protein K460DRAFT_363968 [Cucurbitaria berberidis CBS 394.84]|uniref:DUF3433 domain containing protein n=1 Tax=Cucurbitaria berberidis CBS 394.84 TaxID=1168544 RepID=A0A9P4GKF6_9PLEO|nr:uncharacterized protein K460DRAFT_363968 [Cucurbitaria berberidis CBS 394.84]KAF1847953.1 hypothetical protein K460DRAFT_363968 [Cucurbitaria berberidis CBS 394.84]